MRFLAPLLAAFLLLPPAGAGAGTLTWSFSSDVQTLDPHSSRVSFTNAFLANIYETLVRMDDGLRIEPGLATGWERVSPTVWRFHMRPGVRCHEGQALSADDVVFTWDRLNTKGANRGPLSAVAAMRAPDSMTVEIETAQPFPVLLNALLGMGVMSRSWAEANGAQAATDLAASAENFATRHENGTGPFRVASRQADGSDGTAPDRSADMFRHMFQCMRLHQREHRDERLMPPGQVLEMVTTDAARALGMAERVGSLEVGKRADLITVDLRKPHLAPANMPVWRVVCFANGADVDTVVVDGRVLMQGRRVAHVDVAMVLAEAEAETALMLDRGGLRPLLAEPASIWGRARH